LFRAPRCRAQTIERYEGILIDTSGSISKDGMTRELFEEYLLSTKKLLLTEPADSRVWVSSIAQDSFGGVHEVVKGWTPSPIWIFSDMMNETPEFPMPQLLEIGPERMLERAIANGLVIPLVRYKIYILGASPAGLTPKSWMTIKIFWKMYFRAAGVELMTYST